MEYKPSPVIVSMSGVAHYKTTTRGATVTLANGKKVRLTKAQCPPESKISAFTIADAIYDAR